MTTQKEIDDVIENILDKMFATDDKINTSLSDWGLFNDAINIITESSVKNAMNTLEQHAEQIPLSVAKKLMHNLDNPQITRTCTLFILAMIGALSLKNPAAARALNNKLGLLNDEIN